MTMRRSSSLIPAVLLPTLVVFLVVSWALRAAEPEPKQRLFRPDAPDMPAYSLPDVLTAIDGRKIATAQDWITIRRPEILELFRQHVYGRVPATEYQKNYRLVRQDPGAMDGAATLKRFTSRCSFPTNRQSPSRPFCSSATAARRTLTPRERRRASSGRPRR